MLTAPAKIRPDPDDAHSAVARALGDIGDAAPVLLALIDEAVATTAPAQAPVWSKLAHQIGGSGFQAFAFSAASARALARIVGPRADVMRLLLPLLGEIGGAPLRSLEDAETLWRRRAPDEDHARRRAADALVRYFTDYIDLRLQLLYRVWLAAHPAPADALHGDRVAALTVLEPQARRIVAAMDVDFLASWLQPSDPARARRALMRSLANNAFEVFQLNLRFTHHCNIQCRHCYNSSGPAAKADRLELEDMLRLVAEMPSVPIAKLNISGGEPFLYRDRVVALIRAGRAAGLSSITINTNGFWARSAAQCRQVLAELEEAGFEPRADDRLKVSTGTFHQEFLASDVVFTLAQAHFERFGVALDVDCEVDQDSRSAQAIRDEIDVRGLGEQIRLTIRDVTPLGRAAALELDNPNALRRRGPVLEPCSGINQIVLDPDYHSRPCCGFNNENQGVVIGSARKMGLRELVKSMQNDPLLQSIAANPMQDLFAEVGKAADPAGYAGRCDLCQHAVGDLRDKEPVQARLFHRQRFYPFWFDEAG